MILNRDKCLESLPIKKFVLRLLLPNDSSKLCLDPSCPMKWKASVILDFVVLKGKYKTKKETIVLRIVNFQRFLCTKNLSTIQYMIFLRHNEKWWNISLQKSIYVGIVDDL